MTINGPDPLPLPQAVLAPLTRAAIFLVVTVNPEPESYATLRSFCGDLAGLVRAVEFRDLEAGLTCMTAFGSDAWDRLFGNPRPAELHPFPGIPFRDRHAVATPGDTLFHIRAQRMDIASSWQPRLWRALETRFRLPTRCTAFVTLRIATLSVSSMALRIREATLPSTLRWLARRTLPLPAAATSSSRNTCTI